MVYVNTLCNLQFTLKKYTQYTPFIPFHPTGLNVKSLNPRALDFTWSKDSVELNDHEDLLSDDLGACFQTKTRKKWYKARCNKGGKVEKVFKV